VKEKQPDSGNREKGNKVTLIPAGDQGKRIEVREKNVE